MLAFVAITILADKATELIKIKRQHQPKGSDLAPHLTLIPPGELLTTLKDATEKLGRIKLEEAVQIKTAGIDGVRRRGGAVIWLNVEQDEELMDLQRKLMKEISGRIIANEDHSQEFKPHITILRTRTAAYTNKMFKILESMNLDFEFEAKQIVLYTKETPADDWQRAIL